MKTVIITIWYYLLALDGSGALVEGPTPEVVVVDVHDTEWAAIKMEVEAWEEKYPRTVVARVEMACEKGKCIYPVHRDDVPDCLHCEHCTYGCAPATDDYYVFIMRHQYSFGRTGEIEATVLIPQDVECVAGDIESMLEGDMWAGPCMDPFTISLKREEV